MAWTWDNPLVEGKEEKLEMLRMDLLLKEAKIEADHRVKNYHETNHLPITGSCETYTKATTQMTRFAITDHQRTTLKTVSVLLVSKATTGMVIAY